MDTDLGTLERRLAKAEWNVKLLSLVLGLVIFIAAIGAKYHNPSRLRTPFQVVNQRGETLLQVGESPDGGQSWLRLAQPGREPTVVLYAGSTGSGIDLMEGSRAAAGLAAGGKRRGLALYDRTSDHAAWLTVAPEGGALVFTRQGAKRGAAFGVERREGFLELYDPKGKPTLAAP
jgi:hypothetical protein